MDEFHRQRLKEDADAGNKNAERLLLNEWLAAKDREAIAALLDRYRHRDDEIGARFLEAELTCFHGWATERDWRTMLRECCEAGNKEARFVSSVYRVWAGLEATGAEFEDDQMWSDGWDSWSPPEWTPLVDEDGVIISRSDEFAPRAVVGFLRAILGPQLRPSSVIDPESGRTYPHPVRINQCAQWFPEHLGWTGKLFECRLAEACGYPVAHGEVLSLLHYRPGQRYKPHFDSINRDLVESAEGQVQGGQRLMTILLAMGDDNFTGGDTYFPRLRASAKAATGELLRFNNTDDRGEPLRMALHEGQPIDSGEKWLLSKWVREKSTPYGREIVLDCPGGA